MTDGLKQLLESVIYVAASEKVEFIGFTLERIGDNTVGEVTWRNCLSNRKDLVEFLRNMATIIERKQHEIPEKILARPS